MQLEALAPGSRFRLPLSGRTGTLLALSQGGATVRYDNDERHVDLGDRQFTAPGRPIQVSRQTVIEEVA